MSKIPHDHMAEMGFISSCPGCRAQRNNLWCRLGFHKWTFLFETTPWERYRVCYRCGEYRESYKTSGGYPLETSWRKVSRQHVVDQAIEYVCSIERRSRETHEHILNQ